MKDNPGVKTSKFEIPWHWRAWRARARWAGTRQRIEQWLLSLDPGHVSSSVSDAWPQGLILLGGSAGWMMSDAFLKRFRRVLLVDLDPLAAWLFRLNHRAALTASGPAFNFWQGDAHDILRDALAWDPQACVLFDNFLGLDSMYTGDLTKTEKRLRRIAGLMKGRLWGSVHDRYSGPGTRDWASAACWQHNIRLAPGEAFPQQEMLASVQGYGEWLDHGTDAVLPPSISTHLIPWPIVPGRWHWLQAGWVVPR